MYEPHMLGRGGLRPLPSGHGHSNARPSGGGPDAISIPYSRRPLLVAGAVLLCIGLGYLLAATSPSSNSSSSSVTTHAALREERHSRPMCPAPQPCEPCSNVLEAVTEGEQEEEQEDKSEEGAASAGCPDCPLTECPEAAVAAECPACPEAQTVEKRITITVTKSATVTTTVTATETATVTVTVTASPAAAAVAVAAAGGAAAAVSNTCRFEFVRYEPAGVEQEWVPLVPSIQPDTSVCELMMAAGDRWLPRLQRWISIGTELDTNRAGPANPSLIASQAATLAGASASLSRLVYKNSCTGAELTTYMAPLAGMMRDPRPICGHSDVPGNAQWATQGLTPHKTDNQIKESIILDPAYLAQVRQMLAEPTPGVRSSRRALLFDAGASGFSQGDYSSTRWFLERYAAAGINFDHIYAWEYQPRPGYEFYTGMPADVIGRFSFYNFGVSADLGATTNPIEIIKRVAKPGDFVVFKLDIDTPHIERPLLEQLAADAEAKALISEFFHEHHYVIRDMEPFWGGTMSGSMTESLEMFAALRRGGMRAHVWP